MRQQERSRAHVSRLGGVAAPLLALSLIALASAGCGPSLRGRTVVSAPREREMYLEAYVVAWRGVEVDLALGVLAESFTLSDPDHGEISRSQFPSYFGRLRREFGLDGQRRRRARDLESTDYAIRHEEDESVAWLHWRFPGTAIEGASLLRIGDAGILSEELFTRGAVDPADDPATVRRRRLRSE